MHQNFQKIIPKSASMEHMGLKIRLTHPKNGLFSFLMYFWCFKIFLKKIIFDVKNPIFEKKIFLRNFYRLDRPEGWWRKELRVVTLRACVGCSIGHRPMVWVFKTFSRIRGIERTSNHVRTTHRQKTAYPIPKSCGKSTFETPIQSYFSTYVSK